MSAIDTNRIINKLDEIIELLKDRTVDVVYEAPIVSTSELKSLHLEPGAPVRVVNCFKWNGAVGNVYSVDDNGGNRAEVTYYVKLLDDRTRRTRAFFADQLALR